MDELKRAQETIGQFVETIASWDEAYGFPTFSFLAVPRDGTLLLLQGRLFLQIDAGSIPKKIFKTDGVVVGNMTLAEVGLTYREFLDRLVTNHEVDTPVGKLKFPLDPSGAPSVNFFPFHQEGIGNGSRLPVLMISGVQRHGLVQQPQIDWELAGAAQPYESLSELLYEYSLGGYQGDFAVVEVVAHTVAFVDFASKVVGETAEPALRLAKGADPARAQLSYRVVLHGNVVERGMLSSSEMVWTDEEHLRRGVGKVKIPSGAVLQCFALYSGQAHNKGWIADPALSQNSRRAVFEEFDQGQVVLKDFLFESQRVRKEARDFEVGVAWLLWMLGFSVAHAGATPRTSEAADILASTPAGHVAIVECTTGHLKADSKLARLVERSQTIRKRLDESGNRHLKLLPVIVTSLGKEEVKADLDQARSLGVAVATREDLVSALNQTIATSNAESIFTRALESLSSQQSVLGFPSQQ
jgi:hypothetical protein